MKLVNHQVDVRDWYRASLTRARVPMTSCRLPTLELVQTASLPTVRPFECRLSCSVEPILHACAGVAWWLLALIWTRITYINILAWRIPGVGDVCAASMLGVRGEEFPTSPAP